MKNLIEIIKESVNLNQDTNLGQVRSVVNLIVSKEKVFFIRRSEDMPTHKGDVAFIGGHIKETESLKQASLREMEEETSLESDLFKYLGSFSSHHMDVGVCLYELKMEEERFLKSIKSNGEWTDAFFIPWKTFTLEKNWSRGFYVAKSNRIPIYFCNLHHNKYVLWGMTARIIYEIFKNQKLESGSV